MSHRRSGALQEVKGTGATRPASFHWSAPHMAFNRSGNLGMASAQHPKAEKTSEHRKEGELQHLRV